MLQARSGCSLTELRQLRPFQHADDRLLQALANQVTPQWAPRGTRMIALGSDDEATYFLLEGTVRLVAGDSAIGPLTLFDTSGFRTSTDGLLPTSRGWWARAGAAMRPTIRETAIRIMRLDFRRFM